MAGDGPAVRIAPVVWVARRPTTTLYERVEAMTPRICDVKERPYGRASAMRVVILPAVDRVLWDRSLPVVDTVALQKHIVRVLKPGRVFRGCDDTFWLDASSILVRLPRLFTVFSAGLLEVWSLLLSEVWQEVPKEAHFQERVSKKTVLDGHPHLSLTRQRGTLVGIRQVTLVATQNAIVSV